MINNLSIQKQYNKLDKEWFNCFRGYFFEGWNENHDTHESFINEFLDVDAIPLIKKCINEGNYSDAHFIVYFCSQLEDFLDSIYKNIN